MKTTYLKDVVYAANDGIITTFAVVAGVAGAGLSQRIILILGIANLLADGFSMAASDYLGTKSQEESLEHGNSSTASVARGFLQIFTPQSRRRDWPRPHPDFQKSLATPSSLQTNPQSAAEVTFVVFVVAGFLPLAPYIIMSAEGNVFGVSVLATALALFSIGSLRTIVTYRNWFWSGLEMLFVGGIAAIVAYSVGAIISGIVV